MVQYVEPPPNPAIQGPTDPCPHSTLKKPKGILKNSRTTDCLPGSPMSDIVVTYSERGVVGGREVGVRSTQTLGRNHTFANKPANHTFANQPANPRFSSFVGPTSELSPRGGPTSELNPRVERNRIFAPDKTGSVSVHEGHVTRPRVMSVQSPDIILESTGGNVTSSTEQLFVL